MGATEVTPEGWVVEDVESYRLVADHRPPRPSVYRKQLREDATNWRSVAFWAGGGGVAAAGLAVAWWLSLTAGMVLAFVGVCLWQFWFVLFRRVTHDLRNSPSGVGVVEALEPHPMLRDYSTATALTADGQKVPLAIPTQLVGDIIAAGGRAEVFFLHSPSSQFSLGLAARPVHPKAIRAAGEAEGRSPGPEASGR